MSGAAAAVILGGTKAHEAIISNEDFEIVQDLLKVDTRAVSGEKKAHIYAGLLFCGDCMEPMTRRINRYKGRETVAFICSTQKVTKLV